MVKQIAILLACICAMLCAGATAETPPSYQTVNLDSFFVAVDGPGTFVLLDDATGRVRIHNPERAHRRFIPASTFKIANALIALETGVADGPDFTLSRDTTRAPAKPYWPRSWKRDNSLRTAFQNSVFWYYQEIARRVGEARMTAFLEHFDYGNRDISPAVDTFWLHGGLRISPVEQVDFIRRFRTGRLGLSERSTETVKEMMVLHEEGNFVLRGKTGTAEITPTRELGWLVGYVERGDAVYTYALNMEGEQVWEAWPPQKRKGLVLAILKAMGVAP